MALMDTIRLYSNFVRLRLKNGDPRAYERHWENFWKTVSRTGQDGDVVWDSVPELAAAEDLPRFQRFMDRNVPVLDLGCGNGRQSRFLAQHFVKVIGVDIAPSAIERARDESKAEKNVVFRVLDAVRPEQARALHDEFGDVNIYIRTVMHIIQKVDRPAFVESLKTLLGEKGVLYLVELSSQALNYFRSLPVKGRMGLPPLIERVVERGPIPVGFETVEQETLFPESEWVLLEMRDGITVQTIPIGGGKIGRIPASYMILRNRPAVLA